MLLRDLVAASQRVSSTRSRTAKVAVLSELLRRLTADEISAGTAYLSGDLPRGRIGIGYAAIRLASEVPAANEATLTVGEVGVLLEQIKASTGKGSAAERARVLGSLFAKATAPEHAFLQALLGGGLRQGALEGIMV